MRRFVLFFLFSGASHLVCAQCNEWEKLISYDKVSIRDIAGDRFGNLYVVGSFSQPNFNIGATHIPLLGIFSLFIIKFDKNLNLEWAKSVGNGSQEYAEKVVVDKDDNIVVSGYFYSTFIRFDCIQLNKSGRSEFYVVKYSRDGYAMWAKGTTGLNDGFFADLAITKSNDIIISSSFVAGSVKFDGHSISGFGGYDSFVASIGSNGNFKWLRSFGGAGSEQPDYIIGLDVDSNENVVITGFFEAPQLVFDGFVVNAFTISENYFVAKLNKSGNVLWAHGGQTPVNQAGFDVVVDKNDNVIVAGRFYGNEAKFGNTTLTSNGVADILLVKYDPAGNVVLAKNFGGAQFDSGSNLALDQNGSIILTAYYYSNSLTVDSFTATKPDSQADAFIVTLNDQFTAQCFKRVSGSAESLIGSLHVDKANNTWVTVNDIFPGGTTQFDGVFTITGDFFSLAVSLGNNQSFEIEPPASNNLPVTLGADIVKCKDQTIVLDPGFLCGAIYKWSNGSNSQILSTKLEGLFWVEVKYNGATGRDSILIQNIPELNVSLGPDKKICTGAKVDLNVTQAQPVTYAWENGSALPTRSINSAGLFWVKVVGQCATRYDSLKITIIPSVIFDLGESKTLCFAEPLTLGPKPIAEFTYQWQDGKNESERVVDKSGTYTLTVSSACETKSRSVEIIFFDPASAVIPNVITPNGDAKNDVLMLPDVLVGSSVEIVNRWGSPVFQTSSYANNWSGDDISPGVYFYTVKGPCLADGIKGFVQVMK